jgi:predicted DCC family thiol-disulfide oxidoreductase YuxK
VNDPPILLFDGVCNLCNGAVVFVIRRDPRARFRFAPLQSPAADALLASRGVARGGLPDSFVLVEDGHVHIRSTAALRVARRLRFPWPLFAAFLVVPRLLRDPLYDLVARNRYRWFGKREECMVPTAELRARFLA